MVAHSSLLWYNCFMDRTSLKGNVQKLRSQGKTFSYIKKVLKINIPKSTLSYWVKDIKLSREQNERIQKTIVSNLLKAREKAVKVNKQKRKIYFEEIKKRNTGIEKVFSNKDFSKVALVILFATEGTKNSKGSLTLGNSSPEIIKFYLRLLRKCFKIEERKFRCTLLCRDDQNIEKLEKFWSSVTKIPRKQFYGARVDPRSVGKKSRKPEYKGVCRIDYLSADVFNEIKTIAKDILKII